MTYFANLINWILAVSVTLIGGSFVNNFGSDLLATYQSGAEFGLAGIAASSIFLVTFFATGGAVYFVGKLSKRLYRPLDQYVL